MNHRRDWRVAAVLLFCILGSLVFLAALNAAQDFMCAHTSDPKPTYCEAPK